jgi:LPS-assembly lipoprotein
MQPTRRLLLLGSATTALLAGCGFQLRGSASLPFETIFVSTVPSSPFGNELKRYLRAGTSTRVVDEARLAQAQIDLVGESRNKEILSLNSAGRVREYVLRYSATFRVHDTKGKDFIPNTTILLKREVSFNESAILASESEEALMFRDMQTDVIQQILRRMAAVKLPA